MNHERSKRDRKRDETYGTAKSKKQGPETASPECLQNIPADGQNYAYLTNISLLCTPPQSLPRVLKTNMHSEATLNLIRV